MTILPKVKEQCSKQSSVKSTHSKFKVIDTKYLNGRYT